MDLPDSMHSYGRLTKIVATIGPTSNTWETFGHLASSGLNVARLNMSHGDHSSHGAVVDLIKKHNETAATPIAMMVDTKVAASAMGSYAMQFTWGLDQNVKFREACNHYLLLT